MPGGIQIVVVIDAIGVVVQPERSDQGSRRRLIVELLIVLDSF